jgi:hypothetical protein
LFPNNKASCVTIKPIINGIGLTANTENPMANRMMVKHHRSMTQRYALRKFFPASDLAFTAALTKCHLCSNVLAIAIPPPYKQANEALLP